MQKQIRKTSRLTVSMGVELETYTIAVPENRICRNWHFPRRASVEEGERFTRDWSIGSEYSSRPLSTVREGFFLMKNGLRKYLQFREDPASDTQYVIFPVGGWADRFAGGHVHLALGDRELTYDAARELAARLHDHLPFLMVLCANSPVWRGQLTPNASCRLLRGAETYCRVTRRGQLPRHPLREITYNRARVKKPATLEVRVFDSSLPEFLAAALCVCQAVARHWLKREPALNLSTHENYLEARDQAMRFGVQAQLAWTNHWISVPQYVDLFFRKYETELDELDLPDDVVRVFKYLKKGWNQAVIIRRAAELCRRRHPPTWQRRFARRYALAITELLDGNSLERFCRQLGVALPAIDRAWLGRKEAGW